MKNKCKLSLIILIIFLCSCTRTFYVSKGSLILLPYKGDEVLTFRSDLNNYDTLFVQKIEKYISANDPLGIISDKEEMYVVYSRISKTSPFLTHFITLSSTEYGEEIFNISFLTKHSRFYGKSKFTTVELNSISFDEVYIKDSIYYNDVWVFKATDREYENREDFIEELYWSMSHGVIKYVKRNGENWELN